MMRATPASEDDVRSLVTGAIESLETLEIMGGGTRRGLGRPVASQRVVSMAALTGVTLYEPDELVMSARAGTPLREIVAMLKQRNQELAFDPMIATAHDGDAAARTTIGGVFGVNASGPRRIKAGAARDHLLGFRCVTGRGEIVKSGGRVMKNVTGYDLAKLMTGSYGTLAILTEVTFKVLPRAETESTLLIGAADETGALSILREASKSPHEVSSLACMPRELSPTGRICAALRLEGPAISVEKRRSDLLTMLTDSTGATDALDTEESRAFWRAVRDIDAIAQGDAIIWRITVAPTEGARVMQSLRMAGAPVLRNYWDWAGGLIWLALAPRDDASATTIRTIVSGVGGSATLWCADAGLRSNIAVFQSQATALAALSRRVKDSFDPLRLLNRGRLDKDL